MSAIYKDGTWYGQEEGGGGGTSDFDDLDNRPTDVADVPSVITPLPGTPIKMPVLFDESGAEYVVGRYVNSQGKWKPVYRKTMEFNIPNYTSEDWHTIGDIGSNKKVIESPNGIIKWGTDGTDKSNWPLDSNRGNTSTLVLDDGLVRFRCPANNGVGSGVVILQYTKTTDTWQD